MSKDQTTTQAAADAFNNTFHKCRAEVSMDWWQKIWSMACAWQRGVAAPHPESTGPIKAKNAALLNRLFEMAKAPYYATACDTLTQAEMVIVGLERENDALRAEVGRLASQEPAPAPVGEYPALPEPDGTCDVIVGHEMVGNMQADITETRDGYSADQMHAYLAAALAQHQAKALEAIEAGGGTTTLLQERIWQKIAQHDSVRNAAAVLGVDHSYLYRLAKGDKTEPGEKLLNKLGLRRVVTYVEKRNCHHEQQNSA